MGGTCWGRDPWGNFLGSLCRVKLIWGVKSCPPLPPSSLLEVGRAALYSCYRIQGVTRGMAGRPQAIGFSSSSSFPTH